MRKEKFQFTISSLYFTDAKAILKEESQKKKCSWFQSGYCQFGSTCRFSHYTQKQMDQLHQQGLCGIHRVSFN